MPFKTCAPPCNSYWYGGNQSPVGSMRKLLKIWSSCTCMWPHSAGISLILVDGMDRFESRWIRFAEENCYWILTVHFWFERSAQPYSVQHIREIRSSLKSQCKVKVRVRYRWGRDQRKSLVNMKWASLPHFLDTWYDLESQGSRINGDSSLKHQLHASLLTRPCRGTLNYLDLGFTHCYFT
jgi:hypothetical protein